MIVVGFSRPKGFNLFSLLIRLWQKNTRYSHVYIRYRDHSTENIMVIHASYGDVHPIEYNNFKKKNHVVYERTFNIDEGSVLKNFQKLYQSPYGFWTILGIVLNDLFKVRIFNDGSKTFICSELVATALKEHLQLDEELDFISPKDLYEKIYCA